MVVSVIALHEENSHRIEVVKVLRPCASFDRVMVFERFRINQISRKIEHIDLLVSIFDQLSVGI